ncbi:ribonuclease P protein subunit p30 [Cynoglossus semilaevis]|uniref:Ribonuclease P protein subunit p30 n=1 Tax=Cynoglossus semilaevis TaxID=244447 RepID=A0A3P8UPR1_CYNSE|nr:ribonuclease P protein subunit p30 [Cynoglossus semilaevis]
MSVFMDLNLSYTEDKSSLQRLIETAAQLGYSTVAINYTFELTKKKKEVPKPAQIKELFEQLPIVQGRSRPIRVLNRLTVVMSESSHFRSTAPEYRHFDILALQPTSEKLFHAACMTYDVDIICVIVTEKLPFHFKRGSVNGAIDRGVMFEISYAAAIRDSTMRRYTIANAVNLVERSKGKGMIISSAAERALELRGPYDITNLALLFGLTDQTAKEAVSSTCHSVVRHAETRRTGSGIVCTTKVCTETSDQQGAPVDADTCEAPAAKKHKTAASEGVTAEEGGAKATSAL